MLHRINDQLLITLTDLESSKDEIRRQNEELHRLATRDPMTGCLNRRAFFGSAEPLYAQLKEQGEEVCCIMSDIDHFKSFNDRYGHAVGDQVIKSVAKCLGSELREVDMLCRYGGEEFCIMLPGSTPEQALDVAERSAAGHRTPCRRGGARHSGHPHHLELRRGVDPPGRQRPGRTHRPGRQCPVSVQTERPQPGVPVGRRALRGRRTLRR
jgi:GGDEF domain-containing protein